MKEHLGSELSQSKDRSLSTSTDWDPEQPNVKRDLCPLKQICCFLLTLMTKALSLLHLCQMYHAQARIMHLQHRCWSWRRLTDPSYT